MSSPYRVVIAADVIAALRTCRRSEQLALTRLFDQLASDPFRKGDYVEHDGIGRPIQVSAIARSLACLIPIRARRAAPRAAHKPSTRSDRPKPYALPRAGYKPPHPCAVRFLRRPAAWRPG